MLESKCIKFVFVVIFNGIKFNIMIFNGWIFCVLVCELFMMKIFFFFSNLIVGSLLGKFNGIFLFVN